MITWVLKDKKYIYMSPSNNSNYRLKVYQGLSVLEGKNKDNFYDPDTIKKSLKCRFGENTDFDLNRIKRALEDLIKERLLKKRTVLNKIY